jgi:hypothetical protein
VQVALGPDLELDLLAVVLGTRCCGGGALDACSYCEVSVGSLFDVVYCFERAESSEGALSRCTGLVASMDESCIRASLRSRNSVCGGRGKLTLSILSPRDLEELLDVGDLGRHGYGWVMCVEKRVMGPWSSMLLGWPAVG